jgi:hypothetical protein
MKSAPFTLCLAISLVGCSRTKPASEDLNADVALRQFLDVRSLIVNKEIPKEDRAYLVTFLEFENGKLARRGGSSCGDAGLLPDRTLKAQLLWSTEKPTILFSASSGASSKSKSDLWQKLDGGWVSSASGVDNGDYEGFTILGFAQSALGRDGGTNSPFDSDFRAALQRHKYVGALALKTFKTHEEAVREAH